MPVQVGGSLSLRDVVAVAEGERVELAPPAAARVRAARELIEAKVAAGETVYGVTTGFGSLADVRIPPEQAEQLQEGIVRSHATAVGPLLSRGESRAMLLLRAHVLALGHSGVRIELIDRMIEMLNRDIIPVVPERGSLGASGDLAPLAHLALPLLGLGEVTVEGSRGPAGDALATAGLAPLSLRAKEGLALVNGTQGMLAVGILAWVRAARLARVADVAAAMTVEAALGTDAPFDERLQALRPYRGQAASAANLRRLMRDSEIVASHRESAHLVQDAYSFRCAPQVHGATREALRFTEEILAVESRSVSDNPIVLADSGEILSGGNFHGQPVALALDTIAASLVSMASISERRLYRLLDPATNNGLPAFLVEQSGLHSGFMLLQYTAASLVSESKTLAHPASVDSIPSSAGQEDHVSMGMIAARHARECVANAEIVVASEVLAAAQGLDMRAPLRPAAGTGAARDAVREVVSFLEKDRELAPDVEAAVALTTGGGLVSAVEAAIGSVE